MSAENSIAYPLMEHFYTIQGEGANTGKAAYFLRLGGCDVGCVWCDVKESWEAGKHPLVTVDAMVDYVKQSGAKRVVITGGEPAMYDLSSLTDALHQLGLECYIETSGAYTLTGDWDWICVSPKKFKRPLDEVLNAAHELKVIVYNESDFNWAEQHRLKVKDTCMLFLQPEYSVFNKVSPLIVDYAMKSPDWTISLQTHKILQIP
ncbi:MAG: 7-carboxy-7-deazaguanine synthase QueE [Bacteroidetes bacterium]|nr:7-carboxy-7-deazaguanine synthase QueE [Bacteroidota bacterium]